jgi:hypothetical protein
MAVQAASSDTAENRERKRSMTQAPINAQCGSSGTAGRFGPDYAGAHQILKHQHWRAFQGENVWKSAPMLAFHFLNPPRHWGNARRNGRFGEGFPL